MWELLGCPRGFDVIEMGAGRGLLAREVWRYALTRAPQLAAALRYTLVDRATGTALHAARAARLASALADLGAPTGAVRWSETLPTTPVIGCVVANELVDALPVHVVEAREGTLRELFVTLDPASGQLAEVAGSPSSPEVAGYLDSFHVPWRTFPHGWWASPRRPRSCWGWASATSLRRWRPTAIPSPTASATPTAARPTTSAAPACATRSPSCSTRAAWVAFACSSSSAACRARASG